jgi:aminoglycoside phosphotransferase
VSAHYGVGRGNVTAGPGSDSILAEACATVGLSSHRAELVRLGENAIFRLQGGVIARVSRPRQQEAARREIAVSRWLNVSGVAAVAELAGIEQPVEVGEQSVTFWEELPEHRQASPVQVAGILRHLHALPVPAEPSLGELDPFVRLSERIDGAVTVPAPDRAWLHERIAELRDQWERLVPNLPTYVIHGDAWAGNVVTTVDGRVVLLDLERCSVGPREWDLVSTAVRHITSGLMDRVEYQSFCDAYGCDVTAWDGFAVLRDIRELRVTCYVTQLAAASPDFQPEARLRIDCLRGRNGSRPWPWTPAQ